MIDVQWWVVLSSGLMVLLALFLTGLPIFIAFLVINLIGVFIYLGPPGFGMFSNSLFDTATTQVLIAIPLFVLMGEFLFGSGAVEVLYRSMDKLVGRSRLRLYYLSILMATVFGALSGAAMGVVAMLGRSVLPGMIERGYDRKISIGTILGGASLAPIIPPSVTVIIIGSLANTSIIDMLIGGILPGLMMAALFLGYVVLRVWRDPTKAPSVPDDIGIVTGIERLVALLRMLPFAVIILAVLGTILGGVATPEESAAMGVLGTILVAAFYRRLNGPLLARAVGATARITAMIIVIMMSSKMFGQLLAFSGSTQALVGLLTELDANRWLLLFIMMAIPFVLCMFIDQIALMLIVIPIYVPLLPPLGFDPIWFWILFLINITVGGLTPPFGYTMFALKGVAPSMPITEIYRASWPFVWLFGLGILLIALFPGIVTFLPGIL